MVNTNETRLALRLFRSDSGSRPFAAVGDGLVHALSAVSADSSPERDHSPGSLPVAGSGRDTGGLAALPPAPTPPSTHGRRLHSASAPAGRALSPLSLLFCEGFQPSASNLDVDLRRRNGCAGFCEPNFRLEEFAFRPRKFVVTGARAGPGCWLS